ncbi:UDP-N-acetylenolpyruvoylglucosamine reductase [Pseudopedobacter saltans DSM 12145]|uniref:UDP-N-acetylenolpyruvoylglucosamine reductase n=1 Tax=Pseudopedobacter saltans (strain ATCC 51119 / DSM 12145 / JCM 21818 / CCUG 39354 / LMG 10337 / NBRC 100064 / NCIMB 13643) TaxID=762903 RepID=F0SET5_PSESL|nr:UDP-N-acetylmuramate dehydrogenase [Pseudopedobacter saltans]ADY53001.1 UDP-N-acetylenolpyruvoylglucosamine reductase [Pseudopedobacter saltans DSM 12145]
MLNILENVSLKKYNSFGINVNTRYFVEINQKEDLVELFSDEQWKSYPRLILGGGSNILFTKDYDGLIIKMNIKFIESEINGENVSVNAGAGVVWNDLVTYCVNQGYAGIENLSLIPGSVGASPIQNIGAYGVEVKDVFDSCETFEIETGLFKTFSKNDCKFGYRESVFKQELKSKYIVCSVTYALSLSPNINTSYGAISTELEKREVSKPTIKDVSEVVSSIRVSKLPDPSTIGNAGSFFKNPIIPHQKVEELLSEYPDLVHYKVDENNTKLAAGWLIEQCGWKGKVVGNTGTWKNQALVLVNHGGATGKEVFDFSDLIISDVNKKFGVFLEREVNII